ncbi:hypothetical protein J3458_003441 [Metarhizium acridum]|uniref:uncharacterized protein n=1 Tax=Metarhizium acridum TaxID=92637 RepID=UPI001C6B8BB1|nr:hypothetical protein J3458_003441 [Metarhizium acridum]
MCEGSNGRFARLRPSSLAKPWQPALPGTNPKTWHASLSSLDGFFVPHVGARNLATTAMAWPRGGQRQLFQIMLTQAPAHVYLRPGKMETFVRPFQVNCGRRNSQAAPP